LGITDIDPIKENISLARFMHVQRNDLPDIDMDFPHKQRDRLYEKIFAKYEGRVARISNHVYYGNKTALKQVIKDRGHTGFIPKDFNLDDYFSDEDEQIDVIMDAYKLRGEFKNFSLHCGGIIIFDEKVPDKYKLKDFQINRYDYKKDDPDAKKGIQISLNKDQVDDLSFIKIDILSNRGLSELWDISQIPIEDYPSRDKLTEELLAKGDNIGLVYAESRAIAKVFKIIKPKSIQDIALALAIIRPSASGNNQKQSYLRNYIDIVESGKKFNDKKEINIVKTGVNKFNLNKDINSSNFKKYIIYDDDAIQVIQELLKCNESDADKYRKAFSKNKYELKLKFKLLLKKKNPQLSRLELENIYEQLCCLQDYSFCKSHAISYAKLVWALAYQKVHNPTKFWLAALNNCNSSYRTWVHFRNAANVNISLDKSIITGGRRPWKLEQNNEDGIIYLVSDSYPDFNISRRKTKKLNVENANKENKVNKVNKEKKTKKIAKQTSLRCWFTNTEINSKKEIETETQTDKIQKRQLKELLTYGFWTSKEFIYNCYLDIDDSEEGKVKMSYNKYSTELDKDKNPIEKKEKINYEVNKCKFRGLIACYRICKTDRNSKKYSSSKSIITNDDGNSGNETEKKSKFITFVTIGINNNELIDCVLWGSINLKKIKIIEGEGLWMNNKPENALTPWIKVTKWKPSNICST
jgi:DNA polymerase III alpha subunit